MYAHVAELLETYLQPSNSIEDNSGNIDSNTSDNISNRNDSTTSSY